jgi:hypothetical protein
MITCALQLTGSDSGSNLRLPVILVTVMIVTVIVDFEILASSCFRRDTGKSGPGPGTELKLQLRNSYLGSSAAIHRDLAVASAGAACH